MNQTDTPREASRNKEKREKIRGRLKGMGKIVEMNEGGVGCI